MMYLVGREGEMGALLVGVLGGCWAPGDAAMLSSLSLERGE